MSSKPKYTKEELWDIQTAAMRDPSQIVGSSDFVSAGIYKESLEYSVDKSFIKLLSDLNITLLVSREYEHLLMALNTKGDELNQTFMNLPHPSGIAVNRKTKTVYVASTRNPNQIIELKPIRRKLQRTDNKCESKIENVLMPVRSKYYPGAYYFHDLAFIGEELYGNSVGQNGIVKIDFNSAEHEKLVWWPESVEKENGNPNKTSNFLQLNSIAAGSSIENSYFSASSEKILKQRPGDIDFPVDKTGVIFSGKTRQIVASGLTRPHSARHYKGKVWVDNSGYGEVGYIENGEFIPVKHLPGWTRGLCFCKNIMFVGISRILPKFLHYAPGLKNYETECGIYAIDTDTNEIIGSVKWPYGNQVFGMEFISKSITTGFLHYEAQPTTENEISDYYKYII
ncbi:DUF4915 domain-containing protein [Bacteroidota bacterium]